MNQKLQKLSVEEVAALIGAVLARHEIDCVLVGGACVMVYSHNKYQSSDLDMVSHAPISAIRTALAEIGFYEKGRYFVHPNCPFFIDFVSPPVAIGNEPVREFGTIRNKLGAVRLLTPTDCVKDRLAAYFHWDDRQSLEQAVLVANEQPVDLEEIARWAQGEGHEEKCELFRREVLKSA